MKDKELRRFLRVLYQTVEELNGQAESNTERISAMEAAMSSLLTAAPKQFEQFLSTTREHAQKIASQKRKLSEFETILQILAQPDQE